MKLRLILFSVFLLSGLVADAQLLSVTLSGTVIDQGSVTWANGTYAFTFQPSPNQSGPYFVGPNSFPPSAWTITGNISNTGTFSQSMTPNNQITPAGSQWQLKFCPNATAPCINFNYTVTQTQDISSVITANAAALKIAPEPIVRAYNDFQVAVNPSMVGYIYQNVVTNKPRYWNGSGWNDFGASPPEVYATSYGGADIYAKAANAYAACNNLCNVRIPAGTYPITTSLILFAPTAGGSVGWGQLTMDPGAIINYTGTGHVLDMPKAYASGTYFKVVGGTINCITDHVNTVGINIWPSNHQMVSDTVVNGCGTNIWNQGANTGVIANTRLTGGVYGLKMSGMVCQNVAPFTNCSVSLGLPICDGSHVAPNCELGFAPNAYLVQGNNIAGNQYGIVETDAGLPVTAALENVYLGNVIENNTVRDIYSIFSRGARFVYNYLESGVAVPAAFGNNGGDGFPTGNATAATFSWNHITVSGSTTATVKLQAGSMSSMEGNSEVTVGGFPTCFFDVYSALPSAIGYNYTTIPEFGGGPYSDPNRLVAGHSTEFYQCQGGSNGGPSGSFYRLPIDSVEPPGGNNANIFRIINGSLAADVNATVGNNLTIGSLLTAYTSVSVWPVTPTIIAQIGPLTIWAAQGAPGGACGTTTTGNIWFNAADIWYCKSNVWTVVI